jgi:hypothetical protein
MRRNLLLIATLSLLLGVAPATRPSTAPAVPTRFQLRVCTYAGSDVVSSIDLTVDGGGPFATKARVGDKTLALDGTLRRVDRRAWRLQVHYGEANPSTGSVGHATVSTMLEPELGRETELFEVDGPAGIRRRTTLTLTANP